MASEEADDSTGIDFFDNLVDDDDSIIVGYASDKISREISALSLEDVEEPAEDDGSKGDDLPTVEISSSIVKDSTANSVDNHVAGDASAHDGATAELCHTESKAQEKNGIARIQTAQWSSFGAEASSGLEGFGSYFDILNQDGGDFSSNVPGGVFQDFSDSTVAGVPPVNDDRFGYDASDTQSSQFVETAAAMEVSPVSEPLGIDANDPKYWEQQYPGWKYDQSTQQWYIADNSSSAVATSVDGTNVKNNLSENLYQEGTKFSFSGLKSQQTHSIVQTVTEESTASSKLLTWDQVPQNSTRYPQNMVFDSQYPGWYYDTNTGQWYTLESYMQSIQVAPSTAPDRSVGSFMVLSNQNNTIIQHHSTENTGSHVVGNDRESLSFSSYASQSQWDPRRSYIESTQVNKLSENHLSKSILDSTDENIVNQNNQRAVDKNFIHAESHNFVEPNVIAPLQQLGPKEDQFKAQLQHMPSPEFTMSSSLYGAQILTGIEQQANHSTSPSFPNFAFQPHGGRSTAGRPAHAIVAFGFGGKLLVSRNLSSFAPGFGKGSQDNCGSSISVLSMAEVVMERLDSSGAINCNVYSYFHALCRHASPGPLGSNVPVKDVNKWLDDRITICESYADYQAGYLQKLVLSLLKLSCQYYGKLRSPYGSESSPEDNDCPEMAVTKMFSSAAKKINQNKQYDSYIRCVQHLPSEAQLQARALEVQNLLVAGRRKEALQYAQDGQLWGPALVLAVQLGNKYYVDTVKKMAHSHFVSGSPLRTLCLLIAGQPLEVFSVPSMANSWFGAAANPTPPNMKVTSGCMLDEWEENLAIIAANRTKDDELVITHLGDCLWKERGEVLAAHSCYLVAERNIEAYSETARMCLIGADHWKNPRTFASPVAIQMTEVYEYAKVSGNAQYILLPFQPYKLIYAHMLVEMGKTNAALKYCQASLKLLKSSVRYPESELWKQSFSSLEEQIRINQQGGYSNYPGKIVVNFFGQIDRSIHRMIGGPPTPLPSSHPGSASDANSSNLQHANASTSQSMIMATSTLAPSKSVEPMSEIAGNASDKSKHNRSASEPPAKGGDQIGAQRDASAVSNSRFGWLGSKLQKIGLIARPRNEAKLGESNKFQYDEKLKRWVLEGEESPAEELSLPPPPTAASLPNGMQEYNPVNHAAMGDVSSAGPSSQMELVSTIPQIQTSQNPFSAQNRGVRQRYVDTFNKNGGPSARPLRSSPAPKPPADVKFFVPMMPASEHEEQKNDQSTESSHRANVMDESSPSVSHDASFASPPVAPSTDLPEYPSMGNISPHVGGSGASSGKSRVPPSHNRSASWSEAFDAQAAQPIFPNRAASPPFPPHQQLS